jgi:hypothetical protein
MIYSINDFAMSSSALVEEFSANASDYWNYWKYCVW